MITSPQKYLILFTVIFFSSIKVFCQDNYKLLINLVDKDSSFASGKTADKLSSLSLQSNFNSQVLCADYISKLPVLLAGKGFPAASIDSVFYDTSHADIYLYLGKQLRWAQIKQGNADKKLLSEIGWTDEQFNNKPIDFAQLYLQQQRILNYYERSGYPFAAVKLDSAAFDGDKINASLRIDRGPLYHIDSIRVYGKIKIKNLFLQRYLGITKGGLYNKTKLDNISKRIAELPYLQERQRWDISMLGSGGVLNLYLQPKRSSQVNFLIGFLPSATANGKTQLTGEVNLDLKNALGAGESILLNWQQLQRQSPRLNLGYQHPFIFNSAFGFDFTFDLLKRDSNYLQINGKIGLQYILSSYQSGTIFFENQRTYLLQGGYDTNQIRVTKKLPANIDVSSSSVGIDYEWINTNYKFNPRTGNEFRLITTAGLKTIAKNNDISSLKDPANPSFNFNSLYDSLKLKTYQFRAQLKAGHYFPAGKKSVLKTGINAGWFSSQNIFRNELFQIGGYKLLRGFNEESIYASRYAVFTLEYRYLVGINSYLFVFTDYGLTKTAYQTNNFQNNFLGVGLGLTFETKFGLLNLSYAVGKRNDVKFDIRESSKIHFGYINYF